MAWHLYLLPIVVNAKGERDPKYLADLGVNWGMVDYGFQPVAIAGADLSDAQDVTLLANSDVTRIPDDLESKVTTNFLRDALEAFNIPAAGWINPSQSYREVLRIVYGMFAYLQRYSVISGNTAAVIGGNVTLGTRFNQLTKQMQDDFIATAAAMGLSTAGITAQNTLRQILKIMSDQWGQFQFNCGEIKI